MKKVCIALVAMVALSGFGFAGTSDDAHDHVQLLDSVMFFAGSSDDAGDVVQGLEMYIAGSNDDAGDVV